MVYLSNLLREVQAAPARRDKIINHFVDTLSQPAAAEFGSEVWDEVRTASCPCSSHATISRRKGPTQHFVVTDWLADVFICYAIRSKNMFRFVTGWDVNRWGQTNEILHAPGHRKSGRAALAEGTHGGAAEGFGARHRRR